MSSETDAVKAYFDAWDSHDTDAILGSLTPDGTYSDPVGGDNLSGQAYADYASSLFAAFPDLKLELISNTVASNGAIAVIKNLQKKTAYPLYKVHVTLVALIGEKGESHQPMVIYLLCNRLTHFTCMLEASQMFACLLNCPREELRFAVDFFSGWFFSGLLLFTTCI